LNSANQSQKTGEDKNEIQTGGHQTLAQTLWSARFLGVNFRELLTRRL
jgi:hypothetical protein